MTVPSSPADVASLFSPTRLKLARETRGWSQTKLADGVTEAARRGDGEPLTSAAVSQFEKGHARPTETRVRSLAAALTFPVSFFATGPVGTVPAGDGRDELDLSGHFRALRSVTASQRRRSLALTHLVRDIAIELGRHVQLPPPDLYLAGVPYGATAVPATAGAGWDDPIEAVAEHVRAQWDVPAGPIPDLIRLLERHGIVVARYQGVESPVHAFSAAFADRPVVVLGPGRAKDRDRFSVSHELAHLVMHRGTDELAPRSVEDQAHRFAAAFLMPRHDIADDLGTGLDWPRFQALKQTWGTSMASLVRRARSLGTINDSVYEHAMRTIGIRGWRTREPGDLGAAESPNLLVEAARLADLTAADLSEATGWPLDMTENLLRSSTDPRPKLTL